MKNIFLFKTGKTTHTAIFHSAFHYQNKFKSCVLKQQSYIKIVFTNTNFYTAAI